MRGGKLDAYVLVPALLSLCLLIGMSKPKSSLSISNTSILLERSTGSSNWVNATTPVVAGVGHENHRGSAWCDWDNDGLLDVYLTHFGVNGGGQYFGSPNQLLKNMGNGIFEEVTTDVTAVGSDLSHHSAWADIDNDGLPDLFVGQSTNYGQDQNHLLHHDSTGVFTDTTNGNPLAMYWLSPRGVSWQDVNTDGFVDLFITNSGGDQRRNRLLINQGDGTFVKDEGNGLDGLWDEGRGVAWCDYDNDGDADVYIVSGSEDNSDPIYRTNRLFRNNGDGTWTDVSPEAGVDDIGHGRGVAWGDINNDGFMDIIVGNQIGSDHPGYNKLFLSNGDGTFEDISESAGIEENVRTRCVSMADYNNDGLLDLYTVSFGSIDPPNRLYRNNGDLTFTEVAGGSPMSAPHCGNSASWADFNNDGWIDLLAVGGSTEAPGVGHNKLCQNMNQNGNHWIEVELCGVVSNRSAIGARVLLTHRTSDGGFVNQMRDVHSGSGYNAQHMFRAHFGVSDSEVIHELTILWPSGIVQTETNVPVDQILRLVESDVFAYDCNRNCIPDNEDVNSGTSLDENDNGIPDECECLTDLNGDGILDVNDVLAIIVNWGSTNAPLCDLNGDGVVEVNDLIILISAWDSCH